MTTLATVLHLVPDDPPLEQMDPDSDIAFFIMSPASAEQVTIQIRAVLDRAWEYIAFAYMGQAHLALGFPSWDDYVDARFGDLRLAVPREHRSEVVTTLAGARMSIRAIAKLLGVGVGTVHRELARTTTDNPHGTGEPEDLPPVLGRDGKTYSRSRRIERVTCTTCGESHPPGNIGCPWDLYAQGIGPSPIPSETDCRARTQDDHDPADEDQDRPIEIANGRTDYGPPGGVGDGPEDEANDREAAVEEMLTRIDALLTDLRILTDLVTRIDRAAVAKALSLPGHREHLLLRLTTTTDIAGREAAGWRTALNSLHDLG